MLGQPLRTLSGGQRRRVELARILFSDADTLLLDEPTNHLDADSIAWLQGFLASHRAGLIVISHDVELLDAVVNKVWHLDANRATVDVYNLGWKRYLDARETDERRRKAERANAEKKIDALTAQADKMRAKATKAKAAQSMDKRAQRLAAGLDDVRVAGQGRQAALPDPGAVRPDPAHRRAPEQELRLAGDLHRRRPGHRQGHPGRRPRLQRRRQDDAAAHAGRHRDPRHRRGQGRARAAGGLLRPGARDARHGPVAAGEHALGGPGQHRHRAAPDPRRVPLLRRRRRPAHRHAVRR